MLHLLTEEHRKKVVIEYRKRVIVVSLIGLLCVCIVGSIFILPTYFLSHGRYVAVQNELKLLDSELMMKEDSGSSESIKNITLSIEALKLFEKTRNPSIVLNNIVSEKPIGVQIKNFIFTPGEESVMTVDLIGRADTRKSLVQFNQKLKNNPLFEDVAIPLGNFAKEKNIDFSIKIIVSTSTILIGAFTQDEE